MAQVTILVPNYKTPELTKLCLRLIRKHTDPELAKVVVIDNDSQDESVDYLKSLSWITLLERKAEPEETGPQAHARAIDLALEQIDTPYVLLIHTDTLVKRNDWLEYLLKEIQKEPNTAGVGSWKLEFKPWHKLLAKKAETFVQTNVYKLIGKTDHQISGLGDNFYYLRSHCALYDMRIINKHQLAIGTRETVGKMLHKQLEDLGYKMKFLPSETLANYMEHLNHATAVLNPQLGSRKSTIKKGTKRIVKSLQRFNSDEVLADSSLDQ
ncbi:glycosyltransferase family 2 protein [Endozoicomonas ascidiicola]|uniref:glycosyltransferase family 2 protein n=1 Tax=Endozoicomonas ascidiicola TaxID=1698521 RepID=UPI00082B3711|nr:glycosyltransferase [Endozoicomonas ascidiicola]